ncbi:uncharacterized protein LOC107883674 [Acyrthosiphon pisum]|uniref:Endonuclease/exonuclease/phosphatase domain-containing protein n=1 Tax=Acyrthosiphon pisum TaxID=7029 RepID=A0A8R2H5I9_ACYPI|nr:uncharacterized protein LOC107883674 [Acyrthosiphon pisum]|eukprot:XP_016659668.1 PREDICTED: uncharacterized protein LOC107883674 [Acyrthosiphon pisum]
MTGTIKIVQHNLNKQRIASQQLADSCKGNRADLVLLQEPGVSQGKIVGFESYRQVHLGNNAGAAIVIMNKDIQMLNLEQYKTDYTVAVSIRTREQAVIVVSSYFKYSLPTNVFIEQLRPILDREVRTAGADVNGHSTLWHSPESNERGRQVENLVEDYLLHTVNQRGTMSTYDRPGMGSSNIDVTLITSGMIGQVTNWSVTNDTDSDHRVISFDAVMARPCPEPGTISYRTDKADWTKMTAYLVNHVGDIIAND